MSTNIDRYHHISSIKRGASYNKFTRLYGPEVNDDIQIVRHFMTRKTYQLIITPPGMGVVRVGCPSKVQLQLGINPGSQESSWLESLYKKMAGSDLGVKLEFENITKNDYLIRVYFQLVK